MKRLLILALLLAAAGCMPPPPNVDELRALEMGMPPDSVTVNAQVSAYFETQLFDPMSAVYKYGEIMPAWYKSDSKLEPGWGLTVSVNAKNRMGGYVGFAQYLAIFRNDKLRVLWPAFTANMKHGRLWGWR